MSAHPLVRADDILQTLLDHGVEFVLIGGLAAQVHGSPTLTGEVDICHDLDGDNLGRLAAALRSMGAVRRGLPSDVDPIDRHALRAGDVLTLVTRFGDIDLLAHPEPSLDFAALRRNAITAEILGVRIAVAGLDDLMAMKRAAGRPKDLIELEVLGALREEADREGWPTAGRYR